MATIAHNSVPSNISVIGIKMESTQGTEATGDYRQMLCSNFNAKTSKDQSGYSLLSGYKGAYGKNRPGSFVEVSFTILAGSSDASQASLTDIIYMLLDAETTTGASSPYTHTFTQKGAIVNKNSWSLYHNDGKSNYAVYTGFVLDTVSITIDKEAGTIPVEVSGMAWKEASTTLKTVNLAANYNIYTPNTAKLIVGSDTITSFGPITLTFACGTEVRNFINDTAFPSAIEGGMLESKVELQGDWNEAASSIADTLKNAWLNGTTQTDNLVVSFGSNSANDYMTLTYPRWEIEDEEHKTLEVDGLLPQNLTAYPVWQGDIDNNGWSIVIMNTVSSNWGSL